MSHIISYHGGDVVLVARCSRGQHTELKSPHSPCQDIRALTIDLSQSPQFAKASSNFFHTITPGSLNYRSDIARCLCGQDTAKVVCLAAAIRILLPPSTISRVSQAIERCRNFETPGLYNAGPHCHVLSLQSVVDRCYSRCCLRACRAYSFAKLVASQEKLFLQGIHYGHPRQAQLSKFTEQALNNLAGTIALACHRNRVPID